MNKLITTILVCAMLFMPVQVSAATGNYSRQQIIDGNNAQRGLNHIPQLNTNSRLTSSAQTKALDMLRLNCFAHYDCGRSTPWEYFQQVEYYYRYAGENLAYGFTTITGLMNAWMGSQTHRDNILSKNFKDIGVGEASGWYQGGLFTVVVVHFGSL